MTPEQIRFLDENQRLVRWAAGKCGRKYIERHRHLDEDDLTQMGNMALLLGFPSYKASRKVSLGSYAVGCVSRKVVSAVSDRYMGPFGPYKTEAKRLVAGFRVARKAAGPGPSDEDVIDLMDLGARSRRHLVRALAAHHATRHSIDSPACLRCRTGPDAATKGVDLDDEVEFHLLCLGPRTRMACVLLHGLEGRAPLSMAEVAREMGITESSARTLYARALVKMRSGGRDARYRSGTSRPARVA